MYTAQEIQNNIALIEKMIGHTKMNVYSQRKHFILWGFIIALASFLQFLSYAYLDFDIPFYFWFIIIGLGYLGSYLINRQSTKSFMTNIDNIIRWLWIGIGICIISTLLLSMSLKTNPTAFILLLSALGTFLTGTILKAKTFQMGGLVLFLSSLLCCVVPSYYHLLINGFAMLLGYVVPSFLLKKEN